MVDGPFGQTLKNGQVVKSRLRVFLNVTLRNEVEQRRDLTFVGEDVVAFEVYWSLNEDWNVVE